MEMDLFYDGWCPYCNYASVLVWPDGRCRCVGCDREWYEERFDYRTVAEVYAEQEAQQKTQRVKYRPAFTSKQTNKQPVEPLSTAEIIIRLIFVIACWGFIFWCIFS